VAKTSGVATASVQGTGPEIRIGLRQLGAEVPKCAFAIVLISFCSHRLSDCFESGKIRNLHRARDPMNSKKSDAGIRASDVNFW